MYFVDLLRGERCRPFALVTRSLVRFCLVCMMDSPRNVDSSIYHPVVLEGHVRIFIVCTCLCVHVMCICFVQISVNVNRYYCSYVVMYVWTCNKSVSCLSYHTLHAQRFALILQLLLYVGSHRLYTCVHHKEAHHISLYKYYDNICCDTVSKHVSHSSGYLIIGRMWLMGKLIDMCVSNISILIAGLWRKRRSGISAWILSGTFHNTCTCMCVYMYVLGTNS